MPNRTVHFLTSALVSAAIMGTPLASEAGGMSHMGTYGGGIPHMPAPSTCAPSSGHPGHPTTVNNNIHVYKPTTIENNIHVYKPVTVNKNIDVTNNIDNSKNITINKPVSITNNIDNSKNIEITKNIDNSKNISINKSIVINKGGNTVSVTAEAMAEASASASANANAANFANGAASAGAVALGGGGWAPEAPAAFVGGDIGNLTVETRAQCTIQEATIVKAIHAVCVSADSHEFPASHMLGDTWISASYEGEVARCIPGSHLKVNVGKVIQSSEGLAAGTSSGEVLICGAHEALRHYKDGLLKCAPAVPVVDCTERTNLRKYGTADMFFSYRAQVCLETREEYSEMSAAETVRGSSRTGLR